MRGSARIVFGGSELTAPRAAWQGLIRPVHPGKNTSVGINRFAVSRSLRDDAWQ